MLPRPNLRERLYYHHTALHHAALEMNGISTSHAIRITLLNSPAALFSWKLFINSNEVTHFGDMRMTCSCDGMGTEGVISTMFTFSVPLCEYTNYTDSIPGGAEIVLQKIYDGSVGDARKFYVSLASVREVNELNSDDLKPGQKLLIVK